MPLSVKVVHAERLRYSVATGTLTDEDLVMAYGGMLADLAFDPALDHLIDLTGVDRLEVTERGVRAVADLLAVADEALPAGVRRRAAAVATSDEALAALSLYKAYREQERPSPPVEIRLFRTVREAREWLGRPAGAAAADSRAPKDDAPRPDA
jgi:hypothetical protein